MSKLHILIVTNNYRPYKGGVVSSVESFTDELIRLGHKVSIITLDFTGNNKNDPDYVYRIKCPIKLTYKTNPIGIPWLPDFYVKKKILELKPDIIHSQHPFLLGISALKASKELKIPILFTYHTRYEQYNHYVPILKKISAPLIKKLALNYCCQVDAIIAPTKTTYNLLVENKIKTPITIIPSGISNEFFEPKISPCKVYFDRKIKLLTVSRFSKEKNIPFLLKIFKEIEFDNFKFTLVGYGPEVENLKDYAFNQLKINPNNLTFKISPPKSEIIKIYQNSDIFLFASKTETQGIVLAEAMAAGLPVIALDAPGASDIIENGQNGYLVQTQQEMVEKIRFLQNNLSIKEELSKNAQITARSYYSLNCTHLLIEQYYKFTNSNL